MYIGTVYLHNVIALTASSAVRNSVIALAHFMLLVQCSRKLAIVDRSRLYFVAY